MAGIIVVLVGIAIASSKNPQYTSISPLQTAESPGAGPAKGTPLSRDSREAKSSWDALKNTDKTRTIRLFKEKGLPGLVSEALSA